MKLTQYPFLVRLPRRQNLPVRKSRSLDGKAGLLFALIQNSVSRQAADWGHHPPITGKFEDDFVQLVEWAVDGVWEDRDFLKMMVPRALLDPTIGKLLGEVGASRQGAVVIERLKRFRERQPLSDEQIETLAQLVYVLAFTFGFLRPLVFWARSPAGQENGDGDRSHADPQPVAAHQFFLSVKSTLLIFS